jgi:proline iminopeptidase
VHVEHVFCGVSCFASQLFALLNKADKLPIFYILWNIKPTCTTQWQYYRQKHNIQLPKITKRMKKIIATIIVSLATVLAYGQNLYYKTFGNKNDNAIVFLHGGPGYNCANFEATTAQILADKGYFVIVYDRRGEGRSKDPNAQFTFSETFSDLNNLYEKFNLKKSTLIGHSYGGVVATKFAEKYPQKVASIILVGAPVSLQQTFKHILTKVKTIYQSKQDSASLKYVELLQQMDTTSIEYSSYCFMHAMRNGFYTPKQPTEAARNIYSTFKTDTLLIKNASKMTYEAPQGFWKNEKYTTIDLSKSLAALQKQRVKIFGLYGKEDGLYSAQQIADLQNLIGASNLKYLDNCSHNVFIDQQAVFLESIKIWTE